MIKFNKFNVTNTENKKKARVHYSVDNHISGKPCVFIFAKDIINDLREVISNGYKNESDLMTDYFERGKVVLFEDHPLYQSARERAAA